MTKWTDGARSLQSKFACREAFSAFTVPSTCSAIDRTFARSGPDTRNATGHGEYGPKTKREARTRASGPNPEESAWRRRPRSCPCAFLFVVDTISFAKFGLGSSGL